MLALIVVVPAFVACMTNEGALTDLSTTTTQDHYVDTSDKKD